MTGVTKVRFEKSLKRISYVSLSFVRKVSSSSSCFVRTSDNNVFVVCRGLGGGVGSMLDGIFGKTDGGSLGRSFP